MLFEAAPPSADDLSGRSCTLPRRGKHYPAFTQPLSPGLASYTNLRPLVYSECSAVLLCYTGDTGLSGLEKWVREVSLHPRLLRLNFK